MILNGIEYNIRFYVTDRETGSDIAEELFEDFEQMNAYIEKTWRLAAYDDAEAEYVFVEVVNGVPDEAGRYSYVLSGYMPMEQEEIDDVIYDMEVLVPEEQKSFRKMEEEHQMFRPVLNDTAAGDAPKKLPLSEFAYLCPHCLDELSRCTCSGYPYYAIQIDRLLVPVIRELNLKGYLTSSCCAGHPATSTW